jgi:hypothetical protein
MPDHEAQDLTLLLRRWSGGTNEALEQPAFRVGGELRRLARHHLRSEQKGHLLESGRAFGRRAQVLINNLALACRRLSIQIARMLSNATGLSVRSSLRAAGFCCW